MQELHEIYKSVAARREEGFDMWTRVIERRYS